MCTLLSSQAFAGSLSCLHSIYTSEFRKIFHLTITLLLMHYNPCMYKMCLSELLLQVDLNITCIISQITERTSRGIGKKPRVESWFCTVDDRRCLTTSCALRHVSAFFGIFGIMANSRKTNAKSLMPTPSCKEICTIYRMCYRPQFTGSL